jgi:hypothetical protein
MVSAFPPPPAGKGQILRRPGWGVEGLGGWGRGAPPRPRPRPATPRGPRWSRQCPAPRIPARALPTGPKLIQTETQTHVKTQASSSRYIQTHVRKQTPRHTEDTGICTALDTQRRAQTHMHKHEFPDNTEEKPKQRMKPSWPGRAAPHRGLGGECWQPGKCEATALPPPPPPPPKSRTQGPALPTLLDQSSVRRMSRKRILAPLHVQGGLARRGSPMHRD